DDLLVGSFLQHVATGADREGLAHVARIVLHREHQHLRLRRLLQQLRQHLDAALAGHDDVEQDHVGLRGARPEDRILRVAGFADDLDVVLLVEQQAQTRPHDGVVVDENDLDQSGTSTRRVVPERGADSMVSRPSWSATRSRIPSSPRLSSRTASESKPPPSSSTTAVRMPSRRTSRMLTSLASACLTTFVRASWTMR